MASGESQIYKLVENNVKYAGQEFGKNLKVNSKVLTDVLYDNIYKIIESKFNDQKFVQELADKMVEDGDITDDKQNVVEDLDDQEKDELQSKIDAAVELIKANKPTLFKMFASQGEQGIEKESPTQTVKQNTYEKPPSGNVSSTIKDIDSATDEI